MIFKLLSFEKLAQPGKEGVLRAQPQGWGACSQVCSLMPDPRRPCPALWGGRSTAGCPWALNAAGASSLSVAQMISINCDDINLMYAFSYKCEYQQIQILCK